METMDLVGWALFGAFLLGALLVVYLIRRSRQRLERIIQQDRSLDLSPVNPRSHRWQELQDALADWLPGRECKLRCVHQRRDVDAYLFTLSEKWEQRRGSSRTTRHDTSDVYLAIRPTGLSGTFTVAPRPTGLAATVLSIAEGAGLPVREVTEGLTEEFRERFAVRRPPEGTSVEVPRSLQDVFVEHRDRSAGTTAHWLESGGQVIFWPDGFAVKLQANRRLKTGAQVRALIEFADGVRAALPPPTV